MPLYKSRITGLTEINASLAGVYSARNYTLGVSVFVLKASDYPSHSASYRK